MERDKKKKSNKNLKNRGTAQTGENKKWPFQLFFFFIFPAQSKLLEISRKTMASQPKSKKKKKMFSIREFFLPLSVCLQPAMAPGTYQHQHYSSSSSSPDTQLEKEVEEISIYRVSSPYFSFARAAIISILYVYISRVLQQHLQPFFSPNIFPFNREKKERNQVYVNGKETGERKH